MLNDNHLNIIETFADMLTKQMDKINKKGDITPDELARMDKAVDILKDIEVICAMEEYGKDPEPEMYSKTGYYGYNSRMAEPHWSYGSEGNYSRGRDSMGSYSSMRGHSRDDASYKMRTDLESKLSMAQDDREREMIMKCLRALDN